MVYLLWDSLLWVGGLSYDKTHLGIHKKRLNRKIGVFLGLITGVGWAFLVWFAWYWVCFVLRSCSDRLAPTASPMIGDCSLASTNQDVDGLFRNSETHFLRELRATIFRPSPGERSLWPWISCPSNRRIDQVHAFSFLYHLSEVTIAS